MSLDELKALLSAVERFERDVGEKARRQEPEAWTDLRRGLIRARQVIYEEEGIFA